MPFSRGHAGHQRELPGHSGVKPQPHRTVPSIRSVLVVIDAAADDTHLTHLIDRACLLPLLPDAQVLLLRFGPRASGERAVGDEREISRLLERAESAARSRGRAVHFEAIALEADPRVEVPRQARLARADVVLVGRQASGGGDSRLAEHLLHAGEGATLYVVRRPMAPYRRPLIAVELDDTAATLLAATLRLIGGHPRHLGVLHAYELPGEGWLRSAEGVPEPTLQSYQAATEAGLARRLEALLDTAPPPLATVTRLVRGGDPRLVIESASREFRADLLVIGTAGESTLKRLLRGDIPGHALRTASCDLLAVSTRPAHP
jgi:nucleotide-binding universal stress UspA family protein